MTCRSDDSRNKLEIIGIINLTPDSFSDGGLHNNYQAALLAIENMLPYVDVIELGAESTRPGSFLPGFNCRASLIDVETEADRFQAFDALRLLRFCIDNGVDVSIDSRHSTNIAKFLEHGASIVNDQSCGYQNMRLIAQRYPHVKFVVMHHLTLPSDRMKTIVGDGEAVIKQIIHWWKAKTKLCQEAGMASERIILDPGVGFGKSPEQSVFLVNNMQILPEAMSDMPIMLGHSRKGFLREFNVDSPLLRNIKDPIQLLDIKTAIISSMVYPYISYLRVHNPCTTLQILRNRV